VIWADPSRFSCAEELCADFVSRASEIGGQAFVIIVGDVENTPCDVVDCLVAASERGRLKDPPSGREPDLSIDAVASMVGLLIYHKCLKDHPFQSILFYAHLLYGVSGLLNFTFMLRWNLALDVPDAGFVTLEECVSRVVAHVRLMLAAKAGGAAVLRALHVTKDDFARLRLAVLLRNALRLATLRAICLVPTRGKKERRREKRGKIGKKEDGRWVCL
jgi:hypothetical protein